MKNVKCIHPIKVNKIIAEFANAVATLPCEKFYEVECEDGNIVPTIANLPISILKEKMVEAGFAPINFTHYELSHYFVIKSNVEKEDMNFSVESIDCDEEAVIIHVPRWTTANYNDDVAGKCFRQDFVSRCPLARGFSDVTISILHEVGHRMTDDLVPKDFDRERQELANMIKADTEEELNFLYFKMPDEILATNWAIEWLQDAEHRKLAKKFEKKFWACFE